MEGSAFQNVAPPAESENFTAPESIIVMGPPGKQARFIFYN